MTNTADRDGLSSHRTRSNLPNRWPLGPVDGTPYDYGHHREQALEAGEHPLGDSAAGFDPVADQVAEEAASHPVQPIVYPWDFSQPGLSGITPTSELLS